MRPSAGISLETSARWLAAAALLVGASTCVPTLGIDGARCPCAERFVCCVDRCLAAEVGCVPGACPRPPVGAPSLEIGEGDAELVAFRPLPAGGRLELQSGIQGGYHVFVQLRVVGLEPGRVSVARRLVAVDPIGGDQELRSQVDVLSLVCSSDDESAWLLGQGQLLFVCPSVPPGVRMADRDLRLEVEASDDLGNVLRAAAIIHPVCPDGDATCAASMVSGCGGS